MSPLYELFSSALPRKIVGTLGTIKVLLPSYPVNKCILSFSKPFKEVPLILDIAKVQKVDDWCEMYYVTYTSQQANRPYVWYKHWLRYTMKCFDYILVNAKSCWRNTTRISGYWKHIFIKGSNVLFPYWCLRWP